MVDAWANVKHVSYATRRNPKFLEAFDKIRRDTKLKDHVFDADLKNTSGCHLYSRVDDVDVRFFDKAQLQTNGKGVIKGDVEMKKEILKSGGISHNPKQYSWKKKKIPGGLPQTFFPSNWSKEKILEECASALSNPNKKLVPRPDGNGTFSRMYHAESDSGVIIRWFVDNATGKEVTSIFPEF